MIRLTIRQMEYFEALADSLHFGRAAASAGVTQPALSAQILEMENRLGCRLFERGGRGVLMTASARELAPRIAAVLAGVREIEGAGARERGTLQGGFRLGVIPTVAPFLLPVLLPRLRAAYPDLSLQMREAVTADLAEDTLSGALDAMLAAHPLDYPGLAVEPLFEDRFHLAVPATEPQPVAPPVAPEDPVLERLMLLEEGHCMRDQALAVCGSVRPAVMANYGATSLTTLLQMVAHGQGVTLLPEIARPYSEAMSDLRVVPFAWPAPSRHLVLAWRRHSSRKDDCKALAAVVRTLATPEPA